MERRINKKIDQYLFQFKEDVKRKVVSLHDSNNTEDQMNSLLQYIYDYDRLTLDAVDFAKRKRVKNVVHLSDRCLAKKACGEQCSRRKKDDSCDLCGTHLKGTPHGLYDVEPSTQEQGHKVQVWAQDIQGIMYYIDNKFNVYQAEDICYGKENPKVIAKYVKVGETYYIPEFDNM